MSNPESIQPSGDRTRKATHLKKGFGIITNIQVYSLHDGPGMRTLVFLKGCPMRCRWCCNPEAQEPDIEVEFYQSKCVACGNCLKVCDRKAINPDLELKSGFKINMDLCNYCGKCVDNCPSAALKLIGRVVSVGDVVAEVKKDRYFYMTSHGGVTLSGGEALQQFDFTRELLEKLYQENIDITLETCGYAPWDRFEQILPYLNLVLYDIKHLDAKKHEEGTGASNQLILSNLEKLAHRNVPIVIRLPLIPEFNLDLDYILDMGKFISNLPNVSRVDLMPFHHLGKEKYRRLSREYALEGLNALDSAPEANRTLKEITNILESHHLSVRVGG